jgi:hypothetical protein
MRWTAKRKADVIEEIQNGRLTPMERHGLSPEEMVAWVHDFHAHGRAGLRATKLKQYCSRRTRPIPKANGHGMHEPPISGTATGVC